MKDRKSHFILISSTLIFLLLLLFIQINQLIETANTEKRHFAQSVKLSLNLVAEQMSHDRKMCRNVQTCLQDTQSNKSQELRKMEWHRVDSIIKYNLEQYDINLAYNFEILNTGTKSILVPHDTCEVCYSESLEIALKQSGIDLMVRFPEKNMFIIKRIGPMFIFSVLLIFMVTASFFLTLNLYLREKRLSDGIKDFINNMVHEFKTPLSSIGFANHRLANNKDYQLPDKLKKYTEIIDIEKNKLQENIGQILDLAILESEFKPENYSIVNINKIIEEAIDSVSLYIQDKNDEIDFQNPGMEINILGSKPHLINAFSNLLDNACKYSDGNSKICIKIVNDHHYVQIKIIDKGIGIPKKYQKYIFEKYYRVPTGNVHDIKGYGIGLSYVKEVVKMHHGTIKVKSTQGKGSEFSIILPLINGQLNGKMD